MAKTIAEINDRISSGSVVVVTAEEMIGIVADAGPAEAARKVDVVTTGTFGPMCSSGMYINTGHASPRFKFGGGHCTLNGVPAYTGLAAADVYLGCNALPDEDPRNSRYPGDFSYGGGHVIEAFVKGEDITLRATGFGTDCYPRKKLDTLLNIKDVNEAVLFNPRNGYQNYNVGVNGSDRMIYTYLSALKPQYGNASYCSAGQLSPLLNDPHYRTVGIGTRIFLGGGTGYVAWHGTQHSPDAPRTDNGVPKRGAGTIAVIGDLKQMSAEWLRGVSMHGYGVSMAVGLGIPIPILNEEMAVYTAVRDRDIYAALVDYSVDYPQNTGKVVGEVNYEQLRSGIIEINGKKVPTGSLSSYPHARTIAGLLKERIAAGEFTLTEKVADLPGAESGYSCGALKVREPGSGG